MNCRHWVIAGTGDCGHTGDRRARLYGVAILTGVGFTMRLFIATLAFAGKNLMASVRLGVLVASIQSSLVASLVLVTAARVHPSDATTKA